MMNGFKDGRPTFVPKKSKRTLRAQLAIPEGAYEICVSSQLYAELAALRKESMLWDELIEMIVEDVLEDTSISILNYEPTIAQSEAALRAIAVNRVLLAHVLWGAIKRCVSEDMARFVRRTFVTRRFPIQRIGHLFLILPQDEGAGSYEDRSSMLQNYFYSLFREQPKPDTVVGMAVDIYLKDGEIRTCSEDVMAMLPPDWTPDEIETPKPIARC